MITLKQVVITIFFFIFNSNSMANTQTSAKLVVGQKAPTIELNGKNGSRVKELEGS
jgi:hypothetical protein